MHSPKCVGPPGRKKKPARKGGFVLSRTPPEASGRARIDVAGEQRVADAIKRSGSRDFWRLSVLKLLPEETREYVPAVLAAQQLGGVSVYATEAEASRGQQSGTVVYAQVGGME